MKNHSSGRRRRNIETKIVFVVIVDAPTNQENDR